MASVALEAQDGLQRARAVSVRAHRMVQEALNRVGAAHSQSAQTNQELGVGLEDVAMGAEETKVQEVFMQGGRVSQIPEWLKVDTILGMRNVGISWQEVLQRLGFGPGLRLGERPVRVGDPIPRELMLRLEVAYAVQRGCPIRVNIAMPQELQPGSAMEVTRVEEVPASSQGASDSQDQLGQGSETTQEPLSMLLVAFTVDWWLWVL